jgi:hypothetical protein
VSWAIAISDDYDDAEPRVILTVDEIGKPARGSSPTCCPTRPAASAVPSTRLREVGEDDRRGPGPAATG